jgi:rhodanese-related sulfurtransferase
VFDGLRRQARPSQLRSPSCPPRAAARSRPPWHYACRRRHTASEIVSFGDLEEAVGTDAWAVVDVREPHEFAAGHIPSALNIPMSGFDPKQLPQGKPVVLIFRSGGRSRNAPDKARAIDREDVSLPAG